MIAASGQRGFSLLEAIVALAVFSAVGVVLFSWINRSVTTVADIDQRVNEARAEELAVVEIMQENLLQHTSGTIELPDNWRVSWQARPLTSATRNQTLTGEGAGQHNLQLFRIRAQLRPSNRPDDVSSQRAVTTFDFTRLMLEQ